MKKAHTAVLRLVRENDDKTVKIRLTAWGSNHARKNAQDGYASGLDFDPDEGARITPDGTVELQRRHTLMCMQNHCAPVRCLWVMAIILAGYTGISSILYPRRAAPTSRMRSAWHPACAVGRNAAHLMRR
jgi:hypothetical protein